VTSAPILLDVLAEQLTDVETGWSVGTFGAIAEFRRDADEAATLHRTDDAISVVTARGGLRIRAHDALRPIASESLTAQNWNQRVALCLSKEACAMNKRSVLSEIGPDRDALRIEDHSAILFDLGLDALQIDICIRSGDRDFLERLRSFVGKSVFAPGNGAMGAILAANPHRVFISRVGRIEVFQPIPPPDGKSSEGPHTHLLPKLLHSRRTHAATEPLPDGWIPCAHFYPPHPMRDAFGHRRAFQSDRHSAFQILLARYGDPQFVDTKRRVVECVAAARGPSDAGLAADRFGRAAVRVALRQLQAVEQASPALKAWLSAYDWLDPDELNDAIGEHPCTA
jgi:hypothetical protein